MAISSTVKVGQIDIAGAGSNPGVGTSFSVEDKQTYVTRIARISVGESPDSEALPTP